MDVRARKEIADVCLLLINDDIDFIGGCRRLVSLRNRLGLESDSDFSPIVGFVSETDDYPEQDVRENFSSVYLKSIDAEVSNYISQVRPSIVEACNVLIRKYKLPQPK